MTALPRRACPFCKGSDILTGLRFRDVPVHVVRLYFNREEETNDSVGDLVLAFCQKCSFVFNAAFDPGMIDYRVDYESTQTHSPTYRAYMDSMVNRLLDGLIQPGAIVDVGCGQGEFLAAFSHRSERLCVGYDPAVNLTREQPKGVNLHAEEFRADLVDIPVALVTCKMTLEHVADPVALLTEIASVLRKNPGAKSFIQVPNCQHIFEQVLFADLLYEHVNYFTEDTLSKACKAAGLSQVEFSISYGGQHLTATAVASSPGTQIERTQCVKVRESEFKNFCAAVPIKVQSARTQVLSCLENAGFPIIWGAGSKAVAFLAYTGLADRFAYAVDINPLKTGTFLPGSGVEIIAPDDPRASIASDVFIMNPAYQSEIKKKLSENNLAPRLHLID